MTVSAPRALTGLPTSQRRAALLSGALGFGLLKLGLDGLVIALIPILIVGAFILFGSFMMGDEIVGVPEIVADPEIQAQLLQYGMPIAIVLPLAIAAVVCGPLLGRRLLRRAGVAGATAVGWAAFGIVTLPWIGVWCILAITTLDYASTQEYPADDWYWSMWPSIAVASLVDTVFGAVTGALASLWMTYLRRPR